MSHLSPDDGRRHQCAPQLLPSILSISPVGMDSSSTFLGVSSLPATSATLRLMFFYCLLKINSKFVNQNELSFHTCLCRKFLTSTLCFSLCKFEHKPDGFLLFWVLSGTFLPPPQKKKKLIWIMFLSLIRFSPLLVSRFIMAVIYQMSKLSTICSVVKLSVVLS